jgi:hypothetical protein
MCGWNGNMRRLFLLASFASGACLALAGNVTPAPPNNVAQWTRFETQFTSARDYASPLQDVQLEVEFVSPSGQKEKVLAFWDGGRTWRVRFSPDQLGEWSYRTRSIPQSEDGLNGQTGGFHCVSYKGKNPLYVHGAICASDDRRYLMHADGEPFFWMADTAWNGVLKSDAKSWDTYLADRAGKGFNVIQWVTGQWLAWRGDETGRTVFAGRERISINPEFCRQMDARVDALNEHGFISAPVLLWAAVWNEKEALENPGVSLPEDQAILLAKYLVARWGAHQTVWILNGDGDYRGEKAEKWKRIGSAVFAYGPNRLATLHPQGLNWIADEFRDEPWYSFVGYQSCHFDTTEAYQWHVEGPPATAWRTEPPRPIIDIEPQYEWILDYPRGNGTNAHAVRRAAYWSLLVSPTAGVTYGGSGIWPWALKQEPPMGHPGAPLDPPWFEAIKYPGSMQRKYLKDLFTSLEWWRLVPAPELLAEQPGRQDPRRFIAVARAQGAEWALAYMPEGGRIRLRIEGLPKPMIGRWFNPRNGRWEGETDIEDKGDSLTAPDSSDWVLWIGPKKR